MKMHVVRTHRTGDAVACDASGGFPSLDEAHAERGKELVWVVTVSDETAGEEAIRAVAKRWRHRRPGRRLW